MRKCTPTGKLIITYTILFGLMVLGVYAVFIIGHISFVNHYDAYDQGYFWTVEMKQNLASFFAGEGYPGWSWYKGPGMDVKYPVEPFAVLASLFPVGYIELGYTIAIILRMYCAGLAFIAFSRTVGMGDFQCLLGSISYVFTSWVINVALIQGQFINMMILLPLIILSVDRIYQGKSPLLFVLTVAYSICCTIYLSYMAGICTVIYIFLRYFHYKEKFALKEYAVIIGKFILYGVTGIMISAAIALTTAGIISGASTGVQVKYSLFKDLNWFGDMGNMLISEGFRFSYGQLGIPIFLLLVMPIVFRKLSIRRTHTVMALIMLIMMAMPFFYTFFNGFGYLTSRWYFLVVFFWIWAAAEHAKPEELKSKQNLMIMLIWWVALGFWTLGRGMLSEEANYSLGGLLFVMINLAAGFLLIAIVASAYKPGASEKFRSIGIIAVTALTLMIAWTCSFHLNLGNTCCRNNEINKDLQISTQRVGNQIEDDGFYRIDQVDGINIHQEADQPANENLWWQTKTLYLYDSKMPARLTEFNRLVGNNYNFSKRVYILSNGNRMGLDFLHGVKYFLGNDRKNGVTGSDEFAGYGFQYDTTIDGVNIFKNKYDSGLGFGYDRYIRESEFLKLTRLEREQALLQAMVLPDKTCDGMDIGLEMKATDIEIDIDDISWEITGSDGITINGNMLTVEERDSEEFEASMDINVGGVSNGQMIVSFDNLRRIDETGKDIGNFYISCANEKRSGAANNKQNSQTIAGIVDYDMNLGYYDKYSGTIRISFSKGGIYTFDRLYVSSMSAENYDKYASERQSRKFDILDYSAEYVKGTADMAEDGFMYFSMPIHSNWDVFVDGKKAEKLNDANVAFFAVELGQGTHEIQMKYTHKNRVIGIIISLIGLIMLIGEVIYEKGYNIRNIRSASLRTRESASKG